MAFSFYVPITAACVWAFALHTGQCTSILVLNNAEATTAPVTELPSNNTNSTLNIFQITQYAVVDFAKLGYELFKQKVVQALAMLDRFMEMKPLILKITRTFAIVNDTDSTNTTDKDLAANSQDELLQTEIPQTSETNTKAPLENKQTEPTLYGNEVEDKTEFFQTSETNAESPLKNKQTEPPLHGNKNEDRTEFSQTSETNAESPLKIKQTEPPFVTNKKPLHRNELDDTTEFLKQHNSPEISSPIKEFRVNNNHIYHEDTNITKTNEKNEGFFGKIVSFVGNVFRSIKNWFT